MMPFMQTPQAVGWQVPQMIPQMGQMGQMGQIGQIGQMGQLGQMNQMNQMATQQMQQMQPMQQLPGQPPLQVFAFAPSYQQQAALQVPAQYQALQQPGAAAIQQVATPVMVRQIPAFDNPQLLNAVPAAGWGAAQAQTPADTPTQKALSAPEDMKVVAVASEQVAGSTGGSSTIQSGTPGHSSSSDADAGAGESGGKKTGVPKEPRHRRQTEVMEMQVLKCVPQTVVAGAAGSVAHRIRSFGSVRVMGISAEGVNQALKAIALAGDFLRDDCEILAEVISVGEDLDTARLLVHRSSVSKENAGAAVLFEIKRTKTPLPRHPGDSLVVRVGAHSPIRRTAGAITKLMRDPIARARSVSVVGMGAASATVMAHAILLAGSMLTKAQRFGLRFRALFQQVMDANAQERRPAMRLELHAVRDGMSMALSPVSSDRDSGPVRKRREREFGGSSAEAGEDDGEVSPSPHESGEEPSFFVDEEDDDAWIPDLLA